MNLKLKQGTISHLTNRNDHHTMSTVRITLLLSLQSKDFRGHSQRTASEGQKCSRHPNITDTVPKLQMTQPGSLQRNLLMGITGHHPHKESLKSLKNTTGKSEEVEPEKWCTSAKILLLPLLDGHFRDRFVSTVILSSAFLMTPPHLWPQFSPSTALFTCFH